MYILFGFECALGLFTLFIYIKIKLINKKNEFFFKLNYNYI